jgi:P63C domain
MTDSKQSKGGVARAEKMTSKQRSDVARAGAIARWSETNKLPKATHGSVDHPLMIGELEIPCYVLDDGRRVLSLGGMIQALGMSTGGAGGKQGDRLVQFATGKLISPFISSDLLNRMENAIRFRAPTGGSLATGYEATILPDLCEAVLAAREARALRADQLHIAKQCEILVRGLARVGIIALVDEATGYQSERERDALHKLLAIYLSEERLAWAKRFPDEFYKQVYRLRAWNWPPTGRAKPPILGHITNDIVYDRLPEGVLPKLQEMNPTDEDSRRRKFKHHQFLSAEVGQPDLRDHILQILPLMRVSKTWDGFKRLLDQAFPKKGTQIEIDYENHS